MKERNMAPDFENFRRRDLEHTYPNLARSRALDKWGWVPGTIIIVLILALIFGW
jgi:hypothetical protein